MSIIYNPQQKLSDNFKMYELVKSSTASRLGIDQVAALTPEIVERAEYHAQNVAQKIRKRFGGYSPNSWFRCEELERAICWRSFERWCARRNILPTEANWEVYFGRKAHPKGASMDLEIVGVDNDYLFEWCKDNLEYDQLIREFPRKDDPMSGWVHVSVYMADNRMQAFTIGG